jgi:putative ubiquitin-RnfH superfamily antitoxin RatB of RatAB toxin-antitoxin module
MADDEALRVTIHYSPAPRVVREWALVLQPGCTVQQAIDQTSLAQEFPMLDLAEVSVGIWGRKCTPAQLLRDRDRIEIYRPLKVDPKVARRERFQAQGVRAAGLFARKP